MKRDRIATAKKERKREVVDGHGMDVFGLMCVCVSSVKMEICFSFHSRCDPLSTWFPSSINLQLFASLSYSTSLDSLIIIINPWTGLSNSSSIHSFQSKNWTEEEMEKREKMMIRDEAWIDLWLRRVMSPPGQLFSPLCSHFYNSLSWHHQLWLTERKNREKKRWRNDGDEVWWKRRRWLVMESGIETCCIIIIIFLAPSHSMICVCATCERAA